MIAALTRRGLAQMAPPGPRSRLSVLMFHRVLADRDPLQPDAPTMEEFRARLQWVKEHFNVIGLREAIQAIRKESLPERPLAITFDDGYADNHDLALPILRSLGLPATFFVATGYLDGGVMFNDVIVESLRHVKGDRLDLTSVGLDIYRIQTVADRLAAVRDILPRIKPMKPSARDELAARVARLAGAEAPRRLMMSRAQVANMAKAGMEIGGHTVTHPILAELGPDDALREIGDGRDALEEIIGAGVRLFAFPNGRPGVDYLAEHVTMVKELGFEGAVSTARGVAQVGADLYQIPRFTPWDTKLWRFGLRLGVNLRAVEYSCA